MGCRAGALVLLLLLLLVGLAACDTRERLPQGPAGLGTRADAHVFDARGELTDGGRMVTDVGGDADAGVPGMMGTLDASAPDAGALDAAVDRDATALDAGGAAVPPGVVAVDLVVDDRANASYFAGELRWKGSFAFDATTARLSLMPDWRGPFAELWDDGGVDVGGHEPPGGRVGDHVWGVRAYVGLPATDDVTFEYGVEGGPVTRPRWIWAGANGTFTVSAAGPRVVAVRGMTVPAWGTRDVRVRFDAARAAPAAGVVASRPHQVEVLSSAWGWVSLGAAQIATDRYELTMSDHVGAGTSLPHDGRLIRGTRAELVLVVDGLVYADAGRRSYVDGVEVQVQLQPGAAWTTIPVGVNMGGGDPNLVVAIP